MKPSRHSQWPKISDTYAVGIENLPDMHIERSQQINGAKCQRLDKKAFICNIMKRRYRRAGDKWYIPNIGQKPYNGSISRITIRVH